MTSIIRGAPLLSLLALAIPGRVVAQDADVCAVYWVALGGAAADTGSTLVAYDSVSLALPSFAFHAWTGYVLPQPDSNVPLSDSLWEQIRATYQQREPLPECFGAGRKVVRVPYDSLMAPFEDSEAGWDRFQAVFPGARGFLVVGRPYFLNEERTAALLYIGSASHWLSGSGTMLYLLKRDGEWLVAGRHAMWRS